MENTEEFTLKHFKPEEFKMGTEPVYDRMDKEFLRLLDECRALAGVPFKITSSFRTTEYNRRIGGSPGSMHLRGRAVDISSTTGEHRYKVFRAAVQLGLSVGLMRNAIHLDNRPNPIVFHYY
jgi:zinc D-Ala-D-Ala carboxypeptidase